MKVVPIGAIVAGVLALAIVISAALGKVSWDTALAFVVGALMPVIRPQAEAELKEPSK